MHSGWRKSHSDVSNPRGECNEHNNDNGTAYFHAPAGIILNNSRTFSYKYSSNFSYCKFTVLLYSIIFTLSFAMPSLPIFDFYSSLQPSSSPSTSSQAVPGAPGGSVTVNATSTLTSTISVETVIIVGSSTTATATLTTPLPVVIVGNSTSALASIIPTGGSPNVTIIPFFGNAPSWNRDIGTSWLLWGTGVASLVLAMWIL